MVDYHHPGSILSLQLATHITPATVIGSFTPFTTAHRLLVRMHEGPPRVVKVYDPRFFSYRQSYKHRPARPWNYELEVTAISQTTES
jgi:hypothetical protein